MPGWERMRPVQAGQRTCRSAPGLLSTEPSASPRSAWRGALKGVLGAR